MKSGHICSIFLEHRHIEFPFLALVVSGGHTSIYKVDAITDYTCIGKTKNINLFGTAFRESFEAQIIMFPNMVNPDILEIIENYKKQDEENK